jgi:hypothetical protein
VPSTATPDSRCRRLRPWVVTQLALRLQLLPASPPRRAARCLEHLAHAGVLGRACARCADPQAPLVAPSSLPRHPRFGSSEPEPVSPAIRQDHTRHQSSRRLPPTGPMSLSPRSRVGTGLLGRHGYLDFAAKTQLPTCFHARLRRVLDPNPVPAFAGAPRPHAARRLLQRSVPRTHPRSAQTLLLVAAPKRRASRWCRPWRDDTNRVASGQGSSRLSALSTPTTTTARRSGFTPT